uniref:Uncharacterized protein n=1 Tax=Cyanothece sp. (strain PCC 7425 / ATCC 29141) TaxID=395961 RepID=B8HM71_CYAP4
MELRSRPILPGLRITICKSNLKWIQKIMAFQFNQLDKITDIDRGIEVLEEEYIPALIETFTDSPEGQAYLAAHPEEE